MSRGVYIFDGVIRKPEAWREQALSGDFRTFDFPACSFHGINAHPPADELLAFLGRFFPRFSPSITFARQSPAGQVEPHFIHSDIDMGDWSAVLYLNPERPRGDGTDFWTHRATGAVESFIPHERSEEGKTTEGWELREHVEGVFNRMVVFPSSYFHSRAIHDNWGQGNESRLVQVVFGKGEFA